jgi:hypothetical protein
MNTQIINQAITRAAPYGTVNSFLFGCGLCYSIQNEKYWHIPLVLFFPAAYTGYQIYKNKDDVLIPYLSKAKNIYFS